MSLMPTISRVLPSGLKISESSIVTFRACRRLTPKSSPAAITRTFRTVTFDALMSRLCWTARPSSTAPAPSTSSQPRLSQCQPVPLDTWPGTVRSVTPARGPGRPASGKPHGDGTGAQPLPILGGAGPVGVAGGVLVGRPRVGVAVGAPGSGFMVGSGVVLVAGPGAGRPVAVGV